MTKPQITIFVLFAAFCRTDLWFLNFEPRMTRMKRRTTNRRRLTTRSAFSSAAFAHATAGGLWSAVLVFPTLFPSLPSVKNPFARRGRGVYGYGKPQVRHGDRTRNARATLRL